jgi:hypothetical protein
MFSVVGKTLVGTSVSSQKERTLKESCYNIKHNKPF